MLDMQKGNRNGPGAKWMKPVVANLTLDDMVACRLRQFALARIIEPGQHRQPLREFITATALQPPRGRDCNG